MINSSSSREPLVVTIDGPAGAGKSTVARLAARRLGLPYLNSGGIYRAVTLAVLEGGGQFDDAAVVQRVVRQLEFEMSDDGSQARCYLGDRDVTARLKDPDVTSQVYRIADVPEYRALLVQRQRQFAEGRGVVAEGRDMGTVIFPDASVKIFLDAPAASRARRQHDELERRGVPTTYADVLARLEERDRRDRSREVGPLKPAEGAILIDTRALDIDGTVDAVLRTVSEATTSAVEGQGGGKARP